MEEEERGPYKSNINFMKEMYWQLDVFMYA